METQPINHKEYMEKIVQIEAMLNELKQGFLFFFINLFKNISF